MKKTLKIALAVVGAYFALVGLLCLTEGVSFGEACAGVGLIWAFFICVASACPMGGDHGAQR